MYKDRWDYAFNCLNLHVDLSFLLIRCTFRNKPHYAGDKTITAPGRFDTDPSDIGEPKQPLTDLRDQDLEEVSSSSAHRIVF